MEKESNLLIETDKNKIIDQAPDIGKTFNRLKELQYLLKKESALKELCKK